MDSQSEKVENLPELRPIEKRVLNNFYWSFHHSQGNPKLQEYLGLYLVKHYNLEDIGSPDLLKAKLTPFIDRIKPPQEHGKPITGSLTSEAELQFSNLTNLMQIIGDQKIKAESLSTRMSDEDLHRFRQMPIDELLHIIISHMVSIEDLYQAKGRPARKEGNDPHSSLIKKYIIDRTPTNSEDYDRLYRDLRDYLARQELLDDPSVIPDKDKHRNHKYLEEKFRALQEAWETNHPGQQFVNRVA